MTDFVYIARDLAGGQRKGFKRGYSREDIHNWLRGHGLIPIEVRPANLEKTVAKKPLFERKSVKYSEIASLCWQLGTMLEGGVPITSAIETISDDVENPYFKGIVLDICERIGAGESFSGAVSAFPKVFNQLFCAMIIAGESSGSMPLVLYRLAEYFDNRDKFVRKVKSALSYPVFVLVFVFIIMAIMMTVIIPKFRLIFDQMGHKLPAFTQAFLGVYDVFTTNILYVIILVGGLAGLLFCYNRTQTGHLNICRIFLKLPLFGKLKTQAFVSTFCRTMSTLLDAGVSIIEAFEIVSNMASNDLIKNAVLNSKERLIEGASISDAMQSSGFFPKMVNTMAEVGEKSGSLPDVLNRASKYYENKMDATITALLSLLGPIVITIVGSIVLIVVVALYLPIFSMSNI